MFIIVQLLLKSQVEGKNVCHRNVKSKVNVTQAREKLFKISLEWFDILIQN